MSKKRCNKCFDRKELTEYYKNKKNKDGLEYMCKMCSSKRFKDRYRSQVPYRGFPPWRKYSKGFPYKSINDPEYLKDRTKLFKEHGSGWWWELDKLYHRKYPSGKKKPTKRSRDIKGQFSCEHNDKYYQPEEKDTNVPESLTCEDCGRPLPIPEPHYNEL